MILRCLNVNKAKPEDKVIWITSFVLDEKLKENKDIYSVRMEITSKNELPYEPGTNYEFATREVTPE